MFIFSVSLSLFVFSVSLSGVLFYFGSSEWRLSSWFLAESTRKPCRRIGIWDTLAAGSATSRWLDSATFYETNILIASSATRRSSPTLATIAIASSVSTPRYDWYGRLSQTADQDKDGSVKRNHRLGESLDQFTFDFISSIFYVFCVFVCCFGDVLMCWCADMLNGRLLGFVVQGSTLARGLFLVQQVPPVAGRQAVWLQSWQDFLWTVLRFDVRHSLWRMWRNLPCRWANVSLTCTYYISSSSLKKDEMATYCSISVDLVWNGIDLILAYLIQGFVWYFILFNDTSSKTFSLPTRLTVRPSNIHPVIHESIYPSIHVSIHR